LLELVRYIHLNPVRAKLVTDIKTLDKYPSCGHAVIMGKKNIDWQPVKVKARSLFYYWAGQGIGVNNGGPGPKAQYLAAGGQYECSAWRANSIRKWIFTDG
jgi:hypothetical protein